jgi:hypothetical protein
MKTDTANSPCDYIPILTHLWEMYWPVEGQKTAASELKTADFKNVKQRVSSARNRSIYWGTKVAILVYEICYQQPWEEKCERNNML